MPLTDPCGLIEIRQLGPDVFVASWREPEQPAFNATGRSRAEALTELIALIQAVEARA